MMLRKRPEKRRRARELYKEKKSKEKWITGDKEDKDDREGQQERKGKTQRTTT